MHIYTPEEHLFLKNNIRGTLLKDLTVKFNKEFNLNITEMQIRGYIRRHKWKSGINMQFKKGNIPYNKGSKGVCAKGCEKTWFKKGHTPHNYMSVGTERVNADGYIEVKIKNPSKWKAKHIIVWEEHNGPVPDGHCVIFGDKNKRNLDINNLILVSRKQLASMNQNKLIKTNADLTRIGVTIADLYSKIHEKEKL